MDDSALVGVIVTVALCLVGATAGTAGYLYATDYVLKADVQDTLCLGPLQPDDSNVVSVKTRTFGFGHDVKGIPDQQCQLLSSGNYVEYHLRTKHTTLYEREGGKCIYDSLTGVLCQVTSSSSSTSS
jgi:hypothetical protein